MRPCPVRQNPSLIIKVPRFNLRCNTYIPFTRTTLYENPHPEVFIIDLCCSVLPNPILMIKAPINLDLVVPLLIKAHANGSGAK